MISIFTQCPVILFKLSNIVIYNFIQRIYIYILFMISFFIYMYLNHNFVYLLINCNIRNVLTVLLLCHLFYNAFFFIRLFILINSLKLGSFFLPERDCFFTFLFFFFLIIIYKQLCDIFLFARCVTLLSKV